MALTNCKIVGSDGQLGKVSQTVAYNSTGGSNMILYIIPDEEYVVAAADFSITGDYPSATINSITLTNTATAGQVDNKVMVTVDLLDAAGWVNDAQITIDIDGEAKYPGIEVVPHILHNATLTFGTMIGGITVTQVANDTTSVPPTISNVTKSTYTAPADPYGLHNVEYISCTIIPDQWVKIATITVDSNANHSMVDSATLENISGTGTGAEKYNLIQTDSTTDTNTGSITQRVYDLMFKDSYSHNLVGGEWPTTYATAGSSNEEHGVKLMVPRPMHINTPVSDNIIKVIDLHNDLADIVSNEAIPDKSTETGSNLIQGTPPLNPYNAFMSNAVGVINKATEDEPNPISIQGVPGSQFTIALKNSSGTAIIGKGLPEEDDGTGTIVPTTITIPDSGVYTTTLIGLDEIDGVSANINQDGSGGGNTNSATTYQIAIEAEGGSHISPSAGKPANANITGDANGTVVDPNSTNNSVTYSISQPVNNVSINVVGGTRVGNTNILNNSNAVGDNVAPSSYSIDAHIESVSGFGTSLVSDSEWKKGVSGVKSFTMTREGIGDYAGHYMVISGDIHFHKFGASNTNIALMWEDHFSVDTVNHDFGVNKVPGDYISAELTSNNTEVLGDWTVKLDGGAQLSITNLTATVT